MKGKSTVGDALRARIMAILQTMPEAAVAEFLERLDAELKRLLEEGKLGLPEVRHHVLPDSHHRRQPGGDPRTA
jgi:hypothetical protein